MIYVVDDERDLRELFAETLDAAGLRARTFPGAAEALAAARAEEPDCVLSDIRMPGLDGFAFFQAYRERFPRRDTPFLFLTSLDDDAHQVAGLELGADDYLTKPVRPAVLVARVRHALARARRAGPAAFAGDLSRMNVMRVLRFCESRGLTGELRVETDGRRVELGLVSGELVDADLEKLDSVFSASTGTFSIFVAPMDFGELADAALPATPAPALVEKPMGQLSGVRLADRRLFQLQTELTMLPAPAITTIVVLDGRTVHKKSTPADPTLPRAALEDAISRQHQDIEQTLRRRSMPELPAITDRDPDEAQTLAVAPDPVEAAPAEDPAATLSRLLDEGYDHLREHHYPEALATWERALSLDPENKTLRLNLEILRKKMTAPA